MSFSRCCDHGYTPCDKRSWPVSVTRNAAAYATYGHNALRQKVTRSASAAGGPGCTPHCIYHLDCHLIVEANGAAASPTTARDCIRLAAGDDEPADLPLVLAGIAGTMRTRSGVHVDEWA
jgi:hypothetical protein